jgi:hypothetical protein
MGKSNSEQLTRLPLKIEREPCRVYYQSKGNDMNPGLLPLESGLLPKSDARSSRAWGYGYDQKL